MSKGEHKSEKFLKINPMGDVPALVENDETMIESGAILLHLAERHQSDVDLIPHDEKQYLQWMVFVNSSLDNAAIPLFLHVMMTPKENHDEKLIGNWKLAARKLLKFVYDHLGSSEYMVGKSFSVVDINMGYVLNICEMLGLLADFKELSAYVDRVTKREAFKRASGPKESNEVITLKNEFKKQMLENQSLKQTKITLYHAPGTRSTRVAWLLYELGVDCEVIDIPKTKGFLYIKGEEYAQINPNGTFPAMTDGDIKYFEAGAMLKYICLKYPKLLREKGIIGKDWTDESWNRSEQYAYWTLSSIDGRLLNLTQLVTALFGSTLTKSLLISSATKEWFAHTMDVLSKDLGDRLYVQGSTFTLADIYLGLSLAHSCHAGLLSEAPKNVQEYYNRINIRPAFRKAVEGGLFTFFKK